MTENESFNRSEEIESEKLLLENSEPILSNIDTPNDDQLLKNEINHSFMDAVRKPYEKKTTRRVQDKMLDEIKKGREERLAALKEMKQHENSNDPIQIFFKSMAATVSTFPPESVVEAKMKVFNIISGM